MKEKTARTWAPRLCPLRVDRRQHAARTGKKVSETPLSSKQVCRRPLWCTSIVDRGRVQRVPPAFCPHLKASCEQSLNSLAYLGASHSRKLPHSWVIERPTGGLQEAWSWWCEDLWNEGGELTQVCLARPAGQHRNSKQRFRVARFPDSACFYKLFLFLRKAHCIAPHPYHLLRSRFWSSLG